MEIRIRATGAVMYEQEFRAYTKDNDGPTWEQTTADVLEALNADLVFDGAQAQPTRYQVAFRDGVEQQADGNWYTKYSVTDMNADAIAVKDAEQSKSVRDDRNRRLSESDWTQLADSTANKLAWATYRQELRDITLQSGFPWDINWPTQPY